MINVDTDLIRRAQAGDANTLSALYERYHLSVYRYLYYRVGDAQTAEDLTSEVFERMLRFLGGFQPPAASFQAWLFQIARNLAIDHARKMKVRDHLPLEEDMVAGNLDVDTNILTSQALRQAVDQLSEEQRDVIVMRFVAGMPIAEVARTLHKSEDAVKGLQRRGLAALRDTLADWKVNYV